MIAPYLVDAARAPLRVRPNHLKAEVQHIAARDRRSLFSAALEQLHRSCAFEPELTL